MFNAFSKILKSRPGINEKLEGHLVNDIMADLSYALGDDKGMDSETPLKSELAIEQLNYSLESLKAVDAYLNKVRSNKINEDEKTSVIARCGAYCGEVIKRNSKER